MDESPGARTAYALFALVIFSSAVACSHRGDDFVYSGTVQADSASVGSLTGGRVASLAVVDGQRVRKGEAVVLFDDRQQRAPSAPAAATRAHANAALNDLEARPRPADIDRAQAASAQADAAY